MSLLLHPNSQKIFEDLSINLPQGLLLLGSSGIGKSKVLHSLANIYADGDIAGRVHYLELLDDQKSISIDQIRQLKIILRLKSSKKRVVIIPNVNALSTEAQNSILKLLEEPGKNIHFLMAANSANDILPTIQSRVYIWKLVSPTNAQLSEYFSGYPQDKLDKALAIGQGRIDIVEAVLRNQGDHPLLQSVQLAKEILAENHFDRLCRVDNLAKNKKQTCDFLDGLEVVCRAALEHAALLDNNNKQLTDWLVRLEATVSTKQNFILNVQPKLLLTQLFMVL